MTLIDTTPGKRGLTPEGTEAFTLGYSRATTFNGEQPIIRFDAHASLAFRAIAQLRMKEWKSSTRWNSLADVTGLLGELAVQRFLNYPVEQALDDFLSGLNGDRGYDLLWDGELIDVKATRGQALKFKFSKSNRHRDQSTAYAFVKVEEVGSENWCTLLGWSVRNEIQPWIREDDRSRFVRYQTLKREGLLRAVTPLKQQQLPQ